MTDGYARVQSQGGILPGLVRAYRRLQDVVLPDRWLMRRFLAVHLPTLGLSAHGLCVDLGGGNAPYRVAMAKAWPTCRHIVIDLVLGDETDLQADVHHLPLASGCADAIMLCQVLQHLTDPAAALTECHRVLKQDGIVLIVYPFLTCQGRSSDFRRWTASGMEQELRLAGFAPVAHESQGGPFLFATSLPAEVPGRLLIAHRQGWKAGRGAGDAALLALAFAVALPFRLLGFPAMLADRLLSHPAHYIGGMVLARKIAD